MSARPETYQDLLSRDSRPVPDMLRPAPRREFSRAPLAVDRYVSQAFFDREAQHLWPRVWQMACREEELPRAGDCIVYEVVGQSLLIVRTDTGTIKAFFNSCLHRGRKLLTEDAHVAELRCPFHGFRWKLDGDNCGVPCRWDFEHLSDADLKLPEAQVGLWGGFVFINMDANAPPLHEYLGVLPGHFARWRLEDCYKAAHVGKIIDCNWKVAQEAFMESYHVIATHPQILSRASRIPPHPARGCPTVPGGTADAAYDRARIPRHHRQREAARQGRSHNAYDPVGRAPHAHQPDPRCDAWHSAMDIPGSGTAAG